MTISKKNKKPCYIFIDESGISDGNNNRQPFFAIGMLVVETDDIESLQYELDRHVCQYHSDLRKDRKKFIKSYNESPRTLDGDEINKVTQSGRHYEFHHTDIKGRNVNEYIGYIDTALKHKLRFSTIIIDKSADWFDKDLHGDYWSAYTRYIDFLIRHYIADDEICTLIADNFNRPKGSNPLKHHLSSHFDKVPLVMSTSSRNFSLIQLCDVLLGSVVFAYKDSKEKADSARSTAKRKFSKYVFNSIELDFKAGQSYRKCMKGKWEFSIWPFKPNKKL